MRKNRKRYCLFFCIVCVMGLFLQSCGKGKAPEAGSTVIYYKNMEGTGLVQEEYEISKAPLETQINRMLDELQKSPDFDKEISVFPKEVKVKSWELSDSDLLVHFNDKYGKMDVSTELLLRAATVQTLVQLPEIDYVAFYIGDQPLKDGAGNEVGYMSEDLFVQNIGSTLHSYQDADLTLYFANKAGDGLKEEEVSVRYNSNTSKEKLIVEQLLKGPGSPEDFPTIPPQTKILGVSVRDGICYVNFDEGFLDTVYKVSPKIVVYSVVNSIIEGGEVGQVQILVNGQSDVMLQESVDLSEPFTRELKYVE